MSAQHLHIREDWCLTAKLHTTTTCAKPVPDNFTLSQNLPAFVKNGVKRQSCHRQQHVQYFAKQYTMIVKMTTTISLLLRLRARFSFLGEGCHLVVEEDDLRSAGLLRVRVGGVLLLVDCRLS